MSQLWPAHGIADVLLHFVFPLLVAKFSRTPLKLHKHTNIAVGTKPQRAVDKSKIDDEKEAQLMDNTEWKKQKEGDLMMLNDQKEM